MHHPIAWLDPERLWFPPVDQAFREPDGLLAVGGDLRPERLILAYREGIFPWYEPGGPILWWSPDPRMVLRPDEAHCSRSLRRTMRRRPFEIRMDCDFETVIRQCAGLREQREGTWITPAMQQAYIRLHALGHAHSVEVWRDGRMTGGLYGVSVGPMFFGESMFSLESSASRIAFLALARQLQEWEFRLIDCQVPTPHLESLGARAVPRSDFIRTLHEYRDQPGRPGPWQFMLPHDALTG